MFKPLKREGNSMIEDSFATCLMCMDGRVHLPTINWIKENHNVNYVDIITELGMDEVLSGEYYDIGSILRKVRFSVEKHNSNNIFIVGHHDCQGNPTDDETHKKQIYSATERLQRLNLPCKITGLWVSDEWQVEEIVVIKKKCSEIK